MRLPMRWEPESTICRSSRKTSTGRSRKKRKKTPHSARSKFPIFSFTISRFKVRERFVPLAKTSEVKMINLKAVSLMALIAAIGVMAVLPSMSPARAAEKFVNSTPPNIQTVPGMPAVVDPNNLYSEIRPDKLSATVAKHLSRVYVPNRASNDVWVIDPAMFKVVQKFPVGVHPQHVVPSWDLKTLWVNNNAEGRTDGSVTPIDPITGKPGRAIPVDDPYNMYFTPDGSAAIIVAEARKRLDFRDPLARFGDDNRGAAIWGEVH